MEALDQAVDLLGRRVDAEAGAGGGGDAEAVHQRLGAVVAGAHRDAVAVEDLGDVVGVDALELERDRAERAPGERGRAEDAQARHLGQPLERVVGDLALVGEHRVHAERVEPAQRRGHPDRLGDRRACRPRSGPAGRRRSCPPWSTLRIIEPPPRNGGISRSRSSRPQSAPIPVGA